MDLHPLAVSFPIHGPLSAVVEVADYVGLWCQENALNFLGALTWKVTDGLVIDASGAGNIAAPLFEAVREAREAGIAVVITSRTHSGRVLPLYAGGGGGTGTAKFLKSVVAHEVGHAMQDATNYTPLRVRSGLVPMSL